MGYERKNEPMMLAPGASRGASALRLPGASEAGAGELPRVDDHLIEPEVTRDEIVRGRRMQAQPALAPHGDMHTRLSNVVASFVVSDYVASTDLQTRYGPKSDFATDFCVRRKGIDAATGARYLEEVCFEVVYTQSQSDITSRAEDVIARGVRRIFAIFVKGIGRGDKALLDEKATVIKEWMATEHASGQERQHRWVALGIDDVIEDACFVRPIAVRALMEAAAADNEIVRALRAKGNEVIAEIQKESFEDGRAEGFRDGEAKGLQDGRAEGFRDGRAEGFRDGETKGLRNGEAKGLHRAVARSLKRQGIPLQAAQKARLEACMDCDVLEEWLERVLDGNIPEELVS